MLISVLLQIASALLLLHNISAGIPPQFHYSVRPAKEVVFVVIRECGLLITKQICFLLGCFASCCFAFKCRETCK